jgi:hypothetical protein
MMGTVDKGVEVSCLLCGKHETLPASTPAAVDARVKAWFDGHVCVIAVRCPKCRGLMNQLAYTPWRDSGECGGYPGPDDAEHCPEGQHLHRRCSSCGYTVWERCWDDRPPEYVERIRQVSATETCDDPACVHQSDDQFARELDAAMADPPPSRCVHAKGTWCGNPDGCDG